MRKSTATASAISMAIVVILISAQMPEANAVIPIIPLPIGGSFVLTGCISELVLISVDSTNPDIVTTDVENCVTPGFVQVRATCEGFGASTVFVTTDVGLGPITSGFFISCGGTFEPNPLPGAAFISVMPDSINLNEDTDVKLCAGFHPLHILDARVTNPAGDSFFDVFAEIELDPNTCFTWHVNEDFQDLSIDMPGTYLVDVDTDGTTFSSEFGVSFFVVPESMIGTLALSASSLAALGGFLFWKRKQGNSQPHSLGDLGI